MSLLQYCLKCTSGAAYHFSSSVWRALTTQPAKELSLRGTDQAGHTQTWPRPQTTPLALPCNARSTNQSLCAWSLPRLLVPYWGSCVPGRDIRHAFTSPICAVGHSQIFLTQHLLNVFLPLNLSLSYSGKDIWETCCRFQPNSTASQERASSTLQLQGHTSPKHRH